MTREECFHKIQIIGLLLTLLNEDEVNELIESCNSNPIKLLIPYLPVHERELYNYDEWGEYFLIKPSDKTNKLYFIEKKYVPKLMDNIKALIKRKWRLNSIQLN